MKRILVFIRIAIFCSGAMILIQSHGNEQKTVLTIKGKLLTNPLLSQNISLRCGTEVTSQIYIMTFYKEEQSYKKKKFSDSLTAISLRKMILALFYIV